MKRTINISDQLRLLLLTVTVTLMIACTDEAADNIEIVRHLEVSNLTRSALRSGEAPAGTSEAPVGTIVQALLMTEDEIYQAGLFKRTDTGWSSSLYAKSEVSGTDYYLYGFMPSDIGSYVISKPSVGDYSYGAVLTFNTSPVSLKDLCVITGISYSKGTVGEPAFGNFTLRILPLQNGETHNLKMRADHIFAGVKFTMKVAEKYAAMRTIRVKKLELLVKGYGDAVSIPLTANQSNGNPLGTLGLTSETDAEKQIDLLDQEKTLTTSAQDIGTWGYFAPAALDDLTLVSTYDVYNKSNTSVIRSDCVAENQLKDVLGGLKRGERITINLTVKPTYLYVLSDDDAELTFVVN